MVTKKLLVPMLACTALAIGMASAPAAAGGECEGDVNGDGTTNVLDLLGVLQQWGECPPKEECTGDRNGDGVVDFMDLLVVVGDFGCGEVQCEGREDCDDGDPCTIDICLQGTCVHIPIEDCEP